MEYNKGFKSTLVLICSCLLCILVASCNGGKNSGNLLNDAMEEINKEDNGYDNFQAYNNSAYFAITYKLENTPENKAKILWLANHEDLGDKFRTEMLKNLKDGDILARLVKEKKALVLAVQADEIEYHVVFTPEEIASKVLKK